MLVAFKSKFWEESIKLQTKSYSLGVRNNANYIVYKKAVEQFGEANVEASWSLACVIPNELSPLCSSSRLIRNFGYYRDIVTILIHWNDVTITNEEDRSTRIKDLFCKLEFNYGCYRSMHFLRTTFSQKEWDARYSHSHLHKIDCTHPVKWGSMCLGSGPINETIEYLEEPGYQEETLDVFFWELDKVVHVESLHGVPYIRMSSIGTNVGERADSYFGGIVLNTGLKAFMQSFFGSVKIPLGFENGLYVSGCTFMDFAIMVTNYWNKYIQVHPTENCGIQKSPYILKDGAIFRCNHVMHDYSWRGLDIPRNSIVFKGNLYKLVVNSDEDQSLNVKQLVNLSIVKYIQRVYLALVNMKFSKSNYGKEKDITVKRLDQNIYTLRAGSGICSISSPYGADTKDSVLVL